MSDFQPDIRRCKPFVAANRLKELKGKSCIPVLGRMGAGKSTTISIQQGALKRLEEVDGRDVFVTVRSDVYTPQVSDGYLSKTLNVGVYEDSQEGLVYIDTAGLNENRGQNELMWTTWSTATILALVDRLKAVLVCVDYAATFGERGEAVRMLAKSLHGIVGHGRQSQPFYEAMIFVFTNPWRGPRKVSLTDILCAVRGVQVAEEERLKSLLEDLLRTFPKGTMSAAAAAVAMGTMADESSLDLLMVAINWAAVPGDKQGEYNEITSSLQLLNAMAKASSEARCFISWPSDTQRCREQRRALTAMIRRAPAIEKVQLSQIVGARETKSLAVSQMLARMAATSAPPLNESYLDIVTRKADSLQSLKEQFGARASLIESIDADWETARGQLLRTQIDVGDQVCRAVNGWQDEKRSLQSSTKLLPIHLIEVRAARCITWNPLSWFGMNSASKAIIHNGEIFHSYSASGDSFDKTERVCDGRGGRLELDFTSAAGHDLKVDVKILAQERYLRTTHERVRALEQFISTAEEKAKAAEELTLRLRTARGKQFVADIVMENKRNTEEALDGIAKKLSADVASDYAKPLGLPEACVLDSLAQLLLLLDSVRGGLSSDLAPGPRASINDFIAEHSRAKQLQRELQEDQRTGSFVKLPEEQEYDVPAGEGEKPVNSFIFKAGELRQQVSSMLQSNGAVATTLLTKNRIAVAFAALTFSCHVESKALLHTLVVFLIVSVLVESFDVVCSHGRSMIGDATMAVSKLTGDLNTHAQRAVDNATHIMKTTSEAVTEKVHVNVDLKTQPGGIFEKVLPFLKILRP